MIMRGPEIYSPDAIMSFATIESASEQVLQLTTVGAALDPNLDPVLSVPQITNRGRLPLAFALGPM
jgi:hypothetical protein